MDNNNPDPWESFRNPEAPRVPVADEVRPDPAAAVPMSGQALPQPPPVMHRQPPTPSLFPYATTEEVTPPESPAPPSPTRWLPTLAGALAGAALLTLVLWATGAFDRTFPAGTTQVIEVREVVTAADDQTSAAAVARKVTPSIVTVDVGTDANGDFSRFGSGSGVVLRSDGLIVTNQHVIADADRVQVIFGDGRIYEADIVGADRRTDLAVLRIPATGLVAAEIGASETAEIGQVAVAVGSPLGLEGGPSLTVGVVSAFGRQVRTGPEDTDILFDMLQTDAPITQGSSGGALVDGEGKLLGITSAIGISSAGAEGIGFAIPVELVIRITDEIIETGDVAHAFLGVSLRNAFEQGTDGAQIPAGAIVFDFAVKPSAAEDAGLEQGDVIVAYDGSPVRVRDDLISGLRRLRVGDTVTLDVVRGTERVAIDVVLGTRPEDL